MLIGVFLALASGVAFGGITSFAALAYQHEVAPLELIASRALGAVFIMAVICLVQRASLMPRDGGGWRAAVGVGLSLVLVGFGYIGSVAYIAPSLAVALLYLYPIHVLVFDSVRHRRRPPLATSVGFGMALLGIIACVGVDLRGDKGLEHLFGMVLAVVASFGMAGFLITSAAAARGGHGSETFFWANVMLLGLASLGVLTSLGLTSNAAETPLFLVHDMVGVLAMGAAGVLYALGIVFSVLALRLVSASLVALLMNIEPLTTMVVARLLLGEQLSLLQYSGMGLAILGVGLGSLSLRQIRQIRGDAQR